MVNTEIMVIGGGASGLMAACAAGDKAPGIDIVLLEKNNRVGRKLLSTGNGRCNLSNIIINADFYHSRSPQCVETVLTKCPAKETLAFFTKLGLHIFVDGDRIYPYSQSASSVLDVLRMGADRLGVRTITDATVQTVSYDKRVSRFIVTTHENTNSKTYAAKKLIVATGGKAAPSTGSDGAGYAFLTRFGHTLVPPYPVLTPLTAKHTALPLLKGIRVKPCRLTLAALSDSGFPYVLAEETGEVLFTEYGLSGIPAMQVSGAAYQRTHLIASLDLLPDMTMDDVVVFLRERYVCLAACPAEQLFTGVFHKRIGQALFKQAGIDAGKVCSIGLQDKHLHKLARLIKHWIFDVTGVKGFATAQATGGGIDMAQFSPTTLQSLLQPGLFATGELLDVYGDCGGYNLHWAWVTGLLAGRTAAGSVLNQTQAKPRG